MVLSRCRRLLSVHGQQVCKELTFQISGSRPRNGGMYCVGRRMKFRSCNSEPCSKQKKDFREEQCAAFDGRHFNINGLPPNVRWVPKYSGSENWHLMIDVDVLLVHKRRSIILTPTSVCIHFFVFFVFLLVLMKDRCKLFCRVAGSTAYYQLRDRVIDGTPCGPDTNDICVQGLCRVRFLTLINFKTFSCMFLMLMYSLFCFHALHFLRVAILSHLGYGVVWKISVLCDLLGSKAWKTELYFESLITNISNTSIYFLS